MSAGGARRTSEKDAGNQSTDRWKSTQSTNSWDNSLYRRTDSVLWEWVQNGRWQKSGLGSVESDIFETNMQQLELGCEWFAATSVLFL